MAAPSTINGDVTIQGNLSVTGTQTSPTNQYLNSNGSAVYALRFESLREATAFATDLPAAATGTFLGLVGGTIGTNGPLVTAGDIKTLTGTRSARITFQLPPEYVAGGTCTLRASAGMQTTVAGTSCFVLFSAYKLTRTAAAPSANLVTTAQIDMNSLTFGDKSFTVTATTLAPGDWLDIMVSIIYVDAATGTAVTPTIGALDILLSTRG